MIKLRKANKPSILETNGVAWTNTLLNKIAKGEALTYTEKTRYRHPQIKAALIDETSGKCAYCESKLLHIHRGDVEHIVPKSLELSKILDWENLTLACEICNQKKSDLDPNAAHIIDPYADDPEQHIVFTGSLVLSKGTNKGTSSRTILDLNRGELMERRKEKLDQLATVMEIIFRVDLPLPTRKALFQNLVANDIAPGAPYTAMAKAFVDQMKTQLPLEVTA